jgi:hypothetical protein
MLSDTDMLPPGSGLIEDGHRRLRRNDRFVQHTHSTHRHGPTHVPLCRSGPAGGRARTMGSSPASMNLKRLQYLVQVAEPESFSH